MKPVLDATCGSRMVWFDKNNSNALFVDKRECNDMSIWKSGNGKSVRYLNIHPDVIADFTDMPFDDESFYHVVFDPPHLNYCLARIPLPQGMDDKVLCISVI